MKHLKKLLIFAVVAVMMLSLCSFGAYAQDVNVGGGTGSITITNAAISETYGIYKLFDATVSTATTDGVSDSIAYTGTIPESLSTYFTKDAAGNITATAAAKAGDGTLTQAAVDAIAAWASTQQAIASAKCTSSPMSFTNLPYGYYVVTSTQGKAAISVDSTNPNAEIIDKNTTPPIDKPTKTADDDDVFIGQEVNYTVQFGTANYDGTKQVISYTITDNFAGGALTDVVITSVKVTKGTDVVDLSSSYTAFGADGSITIPWVSGTGTEADPYVSLYPNGATLEIQYKAKVAASAAVDGEGNTNSVTLSYKTDDNQDHPYEEKVEETIYTYAVALKKVDQKGQNLAGAVFKLPFYVNMTADATDGAYVYAGTEAGEGLVNELTTPADGLIIIKGVQKGTYSFTETAAPAGYNKLSGPVEVTAVQTGKTTTTTTTYLDKDGNIVETETEAVSTVTVSIEKLAATPVVVVNKTGTEMPSTGGIGTTIFYVVGSILLIGAAVVLFTKKRVSRDF